MWVMDRQQSGARWWHGGWGSWTGSTGCTSGAEPGAQEKTGDHYVNTALHGTQQSSLAADHRLPIAEKTAAHEKVKDAVLHVAGVVNEAKRIIAFENDVLRRAVAIGGGKGEAFDSAGGAKGHWRRLERSWAGCKASSSTPEIQECTITEQMWKRRRAAH